MKKAKYANENGIGVADYVVFRDKLPEKYNEADIYNAASEMFAGNNDKISTVVNATKYSVEQCSRLKEAGGFEPDAIVRKIYSQMKAIDDNATTLYVPMADDTFKFTYNKKSYEVELSEQEALVLQKFYIECYKNALVNARYPNDIEGQYDVMKKLRTKSMKQAKDYFARYLSESRAK